MRSSDWIVYVCQLTDRIGPFHAELTLTDKGKKAAFAAFVVFYSVNFCQQPAIGAVLKY